METYLNIYDGGSDSEKDLLFLTAETLNGNGFGDGINDQIFKYFNYFRRTLFDSRQLYITYRIDNACNACKGFSAKITFVDICEKGLNLKNGTLIVHNFHIGFLPLGSICQWLISASDDQHYVNLEFEKLNVRT